MASFGGMGVDPRLDQKFPSVHDMEKAAVRRMPRFIRDYVTHGMGRGDGLRRNRDDLRAIQMMPRYLVDPAEPDLGTALLGRDYAVPFGVAPIGAGGIVWPRAAEALAEAARHQNLPFCASTFAIAGLERLKKCAGPAGWFQLYVSTDADIRDDLINRAEAAGYETLVVTIDIPVVTRRDHDTRNQLSFPLRFTPRIALDIARCPAWALANARQMLKTGGLPEFENLLPYFAKVSTLAEKLAITKTFLSCPVSEAVLSQIRERWKGKLVVKGVLDAAEAVRCRDLGCDAVIVSNHGGRQLEAAPTAVRVLPAIRDAVGHDYPLIADGGIRTGLDICRMLALGADFVLLGRPFYHAVAAMGEPGADHVMKVLAAETRSIMGQLGVSRLDELPRTLMAPEGP